MIDAYDTSPCTSEALPLTGYTFPGKPYLAMKPSGRPPSALGFRDAPIIATLLGRNRASSTDGSLSSPTAGTVLVMTELPWSR